VINPRWEPVDAGSPAIGAEPEQFADYDDAMAWFEAEHESLLETSVRAADAGHDRYAWQLPATLVTFQDRRSHWAQLAAAQGRALAAAQRLGDERGQARARRGLGRAGLRLGQYDEGREHLLRALAHYRRLGDRIGQAHAHHELALIDEQLGRPREALEHSERVLELFAAEGHRSGQANTLNTIGWYHAMLGDYDRTLSYCRQALDIFRDLGNEAGEAGTWDSIGYAHQQLGDHAQAVAAYRKAVELILDELRHPDVDEVRATLLANS
jgi:tetratricopeptide (TPR) repeat protein